MRASLRSGKAATTVPALSQQRIRGHRTID
jgi:hypothetical protein